MPSKRDTAKEIFNTAVREGRVIHVRCSCPDVRGYWVTKKNVESVCAGCGETFTPFSANDADKEILTPVKIRELLEIKPGTAIEVVTLAKSYFGLTPEQVRAEVTTILGPAEHDENGKAKPRTRSESEQAWAAIVNLRAAEVKK
jgi:bifunctional DNA-binding transcriptional regulator/antitoxin component of YhaV-PrlF toxin-antitoxin module